MNCQKCNSERIASVNAKCNDMCIVKIKDTELEGYVPSNFGIGDGDYISFKLCLDCGHVNGSWPKPLTDLESDDTDLENEY